jgi:hypothetical protein
MRRRARRHVETIVTLAELRQELNEREGELVTALQDRATRAGTNPAAWCAKDAQQFKQLLKELTRSATPTPAGRELAATALSLMQSGKRPT